MPAPPSAPAEGDGESEAQMPKPPIAPPSRSKPIEVVAIANGFCDQHRKKEGDKFTVPSMKHLGSWMKCIDPKLQREHEAAMLAKKKKARDLADKQAKVEDSAVE